LTGSLYMNQQILKLKLRPNQIIIKWKFLWMKNLHNYQESISHPYQNNWYSATRLCPNKDVLSEGTIKGLVVAKTIRKNNYMQ
jgi:hypothetical protein